MTGLEDREHVDGSGQSYPLDEYRRGEFVAALTCPAAKEALIVPAALEGQPAPSPDVDGVSALYASVEAAVESAGAAAAQAGALPKAAHELVILAIGVAALNAFIQANVTGPDCRDAPHCPLTPSASAAARNASTSSAPRIEQVNCSR